MRQCARPFVLALFVAGALAFAGCSSNSPSGNLAHIRTVDAVPNGGTATIFVNEGTATGSQTYFQASPYLYIGGGPAGFQFTLSAQPSITYTAANENITPGAAYSVVAAGLANVTDEIDARYPRLIFLQDDTGSVPNGQAAVRLINVAPDSPDVDLVVAGATKASSISYLHYTTYIDVPAGQQSIQIDQSGTSTALAGPQVANLQVGTHYTIYFVEPNITTPTFGIQILSDVP
jgi:hypothetical protein